MAVTDNHPKPGTIIGWPYQGTHATAFNQQGGSDNWQSENAVDIWLYPGTAVTAIGAGTISPAGFGYGPSGHGGRFAGSRLHLVLDNHQAPLVCFYTHLNQIVSAQGQHVRAGETIGFSGIANGVPHLHFAVQPPFNPADYMRSAYHLAGHRSPVAAQPPPTPVAAGASPVPQTIEDAWHELMRAFGLTWPDATAHIKSARGQIGKAVS